MKRILMFLFVVSIMGGTLVLSAQNKEGKVQKPRFTPEQMMQLQTQQMVKALLLDDATAAKFVPVYEKYLQERRACKTSQRRPRRMQAEASSPAPKNLTDEEVAQQLKNHFAQCRQMLDIREKYYAEFSKILSQQQILKIYQQERNNARQFRREFDRRRGCHRGRN